MFYTLNCNIVMFLLVSYFSSLSLYFFFKKYTTPKYYALANFLILSALILGLSGLAAAVFFSNQAFYFTTENLLGTLMILDCSLSFSLNSLSYSFSLLVLIIGAATNLYILNYFKNEADEGTFIFWINAFIASMLFLVYAANFFTLFIGWELIGLTSFFLINFWQAKRSTLKSSFKAFSFNLVSDIFLLVAFVSFYYSTGTTDCNTFLYIVSWEALYDSTALQVGAFCVVGCAGIKSVQLLGHLWLPDSMEAPVPASSLIHSATLVSAGIYLLLKFSVIYLILQWQSGLILLGAVTAAYGGVVAASQTDMKKLLAYSTMSHCGFLWILAATGQFFVTILYLFLHGLFKAATFYCAGSFIRVYGSQDTRWMGRGSNYLRGDSFLLLLSAMNLAGLPFTFGAVYKTFFFKILLLNAASWLTVGLLFIGMLSSVVYFFRITFFALFDFYKNPKTITQQVINTTKINLSKLQIVQPNHIIAVIILISTSIVIVYGFFWILNLNVLELSEYTQEIPGFMLVKTRVETLYATYYLYFYAIYTAIILLLLIISSRTNSFLGEIILLVSYSLFIFLI